VARGEAVPAVLAPLALSGPTIGPRLGGCQGCGRSSRANPGLELVAIKKQSSVWRFVDRDFLALYERTNRCRGRGDESGGAVNIEEPSRAVLFAQQLAKPISERICELVVVDLDRDHGTVGVVGCVTTVVSIADAQVGPRGERRAGRPLWGHGTAFTLSPGQSSTCRCGADRRRQMSS
jgi:hypothetical protein